MPWYDRHPYEHARPASPDLVSSSVKPFPFVPLLLWCFFICRSTFIVSVACQMRYCSYFCLLLTLGKKRSLREKFGHVRHIVFSPYFQGLLFVVINVIVAPKYSECVFDVYALTAVFTIFLFLTLLDKISICR